jgi:hypothetical protein
LTLIIAGEEQRHFTTARTEASLVAGPRMTLVEGVLRDHGERADDARYCGADFMTWRAA